MNLIVVTLALAGVAAPLPKTADAEQPVVGVSTELDLLDPYGTKFSADRNALRVFGGDDVTFKYCPPGADVPSESQPCPIVVIRGNRDLPTDPGEFAAMVATRRLKDAILAGASPEVSGPEGCCVARLAELPEGLYRVVALSAAPSDDPTATPRWSVDTGYGLDVSPPRTDEETLFMHYRRGRRAAMSQRWAEALESANRLLEIDRTSTDAHLLKIEVLARMGRTHEAMEALELAGRRLPDPAKQTKLRRMAGPHSREDFCWIARRFLDLPVEDDCTPRKAP